MLIKKHAKSQTTYEHDTNIILTHTQKQINTMQSILKWRGNCGHYRKKWFYFLKHIKIMVTRLMNQLRNEGDLHRRKKREFSDLTNSSLLLTCFTFLLFYTVTFFLSSKTAKPSPLLRTHSRHSLCYSLLFFSFPPEKPAFLSFSFSQKKWPACLPSLFYFAFTRKKEWQPTFALSLSTNKLFLC